MQMSRLRNAMLAVRPRSARAASATTTEAFAQDLTPPGDPGSAEPRHLLAALDRLSSAVIAATGSLAFLSSERIQLIDAAHKLAWLLVRVHRNEGTLTRSPDIAGATHAIVSATYKLQAVRALGDGVDAIAALFDLIPRIDLLLPATGQRPQ
ncbi:hypothetical protein [Sphingomonas sp. R1]|uniref:hypothetical protein n=1 Tax=Sphingomonas sp. R1 TaxID=399176 RepID=UPI0022255CA2|nr:hypothetical protein [Sphingomonas sp. R1]UYY77934.1 hypothetical protein OIM94_02665 [Sphingomonas sp. R1]